MDDLISRQEVIRLILERGLYCDTQADREISAEIIRQLPSAQPETHDKRTETHARDCISRQAAIDADGLDEEIRCEMCKNPMHTDRGCDGNCKYDEILYEKIIQILNKRITPLPSAQPDIIRCNACKHWTQTTGNMRGFGLGDCDYINAKLVNCNGFCYWAERRTDET